MDLGSRSISMAAAIVDPQWVWHRLGLLQETFTPWTALGSLFSLWQCLVGITASITTTKKGNASQSQDVMRKCNIENYGHPPEKYPMTPVS